MLTRDFRQTEITRVQRDSAFAKALFDHAAAPFLSCEPVTTRLMLRNLVNATVGFCLLAQLTYKPCTSGYRRKATPCIDHLAANFDAVWGWLKVSFDVRMVVYV